MVSWQMPYLAKGCRPDLNNGPILVPRRLFKSDSNNGPSQAISILSYICSCLLLMVSWQVPYLAKGCRPDLNNGLRGDSNSGPILPPGVYSSPTRIMTSPQAISILCQMEPHLFMSPTCGFLAGAILAKDCRPDFSNGLRGDLNSGPISPPAFIRV